jgi:transcriptional regulator with XRE-family HTH domain
VETPQEQPESHEEDLADLIQAVKDEHGVTDSDIARRLGITAATVNAWVHRKRGTGRGPKPATLRKLAAAYGVPEDRVFAAVGRARPGPLTEDATARLLRLFGELTAEQQEMYEIQVRATVEHNRTKS